MRKTAAALLLILALPFVGDAPRSVAAEAPATPFSLLEGTEVARSLPIREVGASVFAWLSSGLLAIDPEGPALLDLRGQLTARMEPCPAAEGPIVELSAALNGAWAFGRSRDGHVCAWEGTVVRSSGGSDVTAVALGNAPIGAWGYEDGRVEGRDPRSGARKWVRNPELGPVRTLRMEASGPRVVGTTGSEGAFVLDTRNGRLVRGLRGPPAFSAAFDPRGERLAVGRTDGKVELWDTAQWYRKSLLRFTGGDVVDVDWSQDGSQLAVALSRKDTGVVTVEVWDFGVDSLIFREDAPKGAGPARVRFDQSGERLVASNGPAAAHMWAKPGARAIPRLPPSDEPPHRRPIDYDVELPELAINPAVETFPGILRVGPPHLGRAAVPVGEPGAVGAIQAGSLVVGGVALVGSTTAGAPYTVDGGRVAAREGGKLAVWDVQTGAQIGRIGVDPRAIDLHAGRVAAVGPDGKVVVGTLEKVRAVPGVTGATVVALDPFHAERIGVGLADGTVKVIDLNKGAALGSWGVHAGAVSALAFSADGRHLASAGPPPEAPGSQVVVLSAERSETPEDPWTGRLDGAVTRLSFSEDASRLLVVSDTTVAVLDRKAGAVLDLLAPVVDATWAGAAVRWADPLGVVRSVTPDAPVATVPRGKTLARSPDGEWSLTLDGDRVSVWDDLKGRLLRETPGSGHPVRAAVFDDVGGSVAVLDSAGSVEVYDAATGEAIRHLEAGDSPWMRFSDDGKLLWLMAGEREAVGWELASGQARERVTVPGAGPLAPDLQAGLNRFVHLAGPDDAWLDTAAVSPRRIYQGVRPLAVSERQVAVVADGAIELRSLDGDRRVAPPIRVDGDLPAGAGAFAPDSSYLAVSYQSGVVRVWEVERPQATLDGDGEIRSFALDARRIRLMCTLGADSRQLAHAGKAPVASIAFEPGGRILVTRDASGFARMWDWRLSEEAPQLGLGAGPVLPVADVRALLLADGTVYAAYGDAYVRAWILASGVQTTMFLGHAGAVTSLAATADATVLVSGSEDGTARAWSTATGVEKFAYNTFGDPVRRVAVSPDGYRIAAYGDGHVLRTWDYRGKALHRWHVDGEIAAMSIAGDRAVVDLASGARWALFLETGAVSPLDATPPISSVGGAPPRNAPPGATPLDPVATPDSTRGLAARFGAVSTQLLTPDGSTWIAADTSGRLQLWDVPTGSLRGVLRAMSDGSWLVDRADGSRYASESLRNGTSPLLHKPPPH